VRLDGPDLDPEAAVLADAVSRQRPRLVYPRVPLPPEGGKPDFATLPDMGMLCVTGGIERDLEEFDALFAASGWRRDKTYPVGGGYSGLELEAV